MKYRSITLNENFRSMYSLVKYTDEYKRHLEEYRKVNPELADYVKNFPEVFSEESDHQSYMIIRDIHHCIGAIYIGTSTNEKDLEIKIHFDEKYLRTEIAIGEMIDQIVESLGLYFYDKENIEIELVNNVDLSEHNCFKYKKKVYDENLTTYIYSNKKNNILISSLINEITQTEKNLLDWKQNWTQKFELSSYPNLDCEFDAGLIKEYENGTVTLNEFFNKSNSLSWLGIDSNKSTRKIKFDRTGYIFFEKNSKSINGIHYNFEYSILNNDFKLKKFGWRNEKPLEVDVNNYYYTDIKFNNLSILHHKGTNRKIIKYISPIINSSSVEVELTLEDNQIEKCYVDFRTHKGNGKVNGLYALRIVPFYNKCTLNFISRDGYRDGDISQKFAETNEELYSSIFNDNLTLEKIDEIIKQILPIINKRAVTTSKKILDDKNALVISNIMDIESQAFDFIKQIKGEIPLPSLQQRLEAFVTENDIRKNYNKQKCLKK